MIGQAAGYAFPGLSSITEGKNQAGNKPAEGITSMISGENRLIRHKESEANASDSNPRSFQELILDQIVGSTDAIRSDEPDAIRSHEPFSTADETEDQDRSLSYVVDLLTQGTSIENVQHEWASVAEDDTTIEALFNIASLFLEYEGRDHSTLFPSPEPVTNADKPLTQFVASVLGAVDQEKSHEYQDFNVLPLLQSWLTEPQQIVPSLLKEGDQQGPMPLDLLHKWYRALQTYLSEDMNANQTNTVLSSDQRDRLREELIKILHVQESQKERTDRLTDQPRANTSPHLPKYIPASFLQQQADGETKHQPTPHAFQTAEVMHMQERPTAKVDSTLPFVARWQHLVEDVKDILRVQMQRLPDGQMTQIRVQLHPEHLGQLDIRITSVEGKMVAQLLTSTQMAQEALERQMHQLRAAFNQQGILVEKIDVTQQHMQNGTQHGEKDELMQWQRETGPKSDETEEGEDETPLGIDADSEQRHHEIDDPSHVSSTVDYTV